MRTLIALLLFVSAAAQAAFNSAVDLTAPGALQSLQERRPDHYAKAKVILALAKARPHFKLGPWIETRLDASDVEMIQWQVTYPAKLKVSFTLDDTRYTAIVVPAIEREPPSR